MAYYEYEHKSLGTAARRFQLQYNVSAGVLGVVYYSNLYCTDDSRLLNARSMHAVNNVSAIYATLVTMIRLRVNSDSSSAVVINQAMKVDDAWRVQ